MDVKAKYASSKVLFLTIYAAVAIGLILGGVVMLYSGKRKEKPMNDPESIEYESPLIKTH